VSLLLILVLESVGDNNFIRLNGRIKAAWSYNKHTVETQNER